MDVQIDGVAGTVGMFQKAKMAYSKTVEWKIGTNVEYAAYVELGTSSQAAQPYLRPALKQARSQANGIIAKHNGDIEAAVKEIALVVEREAKRRCPVDTGNLRASIRAERVS